MAMVGRNLYKIRDYVSKFDPDKKNPTIFKIGILDLQIKAWIKDKTTGLEIAPNKLKHPAKFTFRMSERNIEVVKFGIKNITNLIDPLTKKPVKFHSTTINKFGKSYAVVSDKILNMIPLEVITEIAREIIKKDTPTEKEQKN